MVGVGRHLPPSEEGSSRGSSARGMSGGPWAGPLAGPSGEPWVGPSAGPSAGPSVGPSGEPWVGPSAGPFGLRPSCRPLMSLPLLPQPNRPSLPSSLQHMSPGMYPPPRVAGSAFRPVFPVPALPPFRFPNYIPPSISGKLDIKNLFFHVSCSSARITQVRSFVKGLYHAHACQITLKVCKFFTNTASCSSLRSVWDHMQSCTNSLQNCSWSYCDGARSVLYHSYLCVNGCTTCISWCQYTTELLKIPGVAAMCSRIHSNPLFW